MIPFTPSGLPCYVETVGRVSRPATIEVTDAWLYGSAGRVTLVRTGQHITVCFRYERNRLRIPTTLDAMLVRPDGHAETNYTARLKKPISGLAPGPML